MLVFGMNEGDAVYVGNGKVTLCRAGGAVRVGFDFPEDVKILRHRVRERDEIKARIAAGEPLHQIETDLDYRENQDGD